MSRLIAWMQISVDGFLTGPNDEFDWPIVGFVHPVALGSGKALFSKLQRRRVSLPRLRATVSSLQN